ncbi:MFS transporter [Arthrobacter glacialis]|uniref:MFS transporter n=1 Tax=Arthrobacter glacialis TaxID=1664 RepID=UPI000CD3F101|nr:MFS transporter [Arthrobacter glacialis]POH58965.1 MFS transporter [Arthrobacter glacialis]
MAIASPNTTTLDGKVDPPPLVKGSVKRLLGWIIPANISIFIIWGAVPGILLPLQVEGIDPANKVANLGLVSTISAFAAMLAQPIAGLISDRTRSKFGRRAQLMVAGTLVGGLALIGMAMANTLLQIGIAWVMVQIAYNFTQGPLSAILPDRVPRAARGTFSALAGLGAMLGAIGGQIVGSMFATNIPFGYLFFAGLAVVVITLFVVFNPDRSSAAMEREPFSAKVFLKTFWVNPIAHPDFFWAFTGRLLLYTGYFAVTGFQLYILADYIGLGKGAAATIPLFGLASLAGIITATLIAGPLSDRIGRRKIFVFISSMLVGLALIIPMVMPTFTGWLLFTVISGLGFGAFQAVDQALMSEVLPSADSFAKDLGVVNIAATLPQTLAPGVASFVILTFGGYVALFPIGIALSILGAFAVWFIKAVR